MDKISKAIKKLSAKDAVKISEIIEMLISGNFNKLDIKKLKGFDDIFRVKKGSIRIIFKKEESDVKILSIGTRNDKTYKNY
jgi:mRNA-degrading endonuclease RelE of RelBE toxin-antitoxin system